MSGPSSSSSPSSLLPSLLSPTNLLPSYASIDHYSLRHLILSRSGLPDSPSWLRSQGCKVLLGFLGTDKKEWPRQEAKKRGEYYDLLGDLLPEGGEEKGEGRYDALVTQIHLDVVRSRFAQSFSFFRQPVTPSPICPLAPLPAKSDDGIEPVKRLDKRNALRQRLVALGHIEEGDDADASPPPRSDAILRILFLYALLNPSVGYVQGMVEVAAVVVWTIGSATGLPTATTDEAAEPAADSISHFEADSFWCFSLLLGELRELWDFEGLDSTRAGLRIRNSRDSPGGPGSSTATGLGGMARALGSLGGRLRWADEDLWRHLYENGLSPSIPYYSFRWLATLLATSLPLPSVVRVWDVILCEAGSANTNAAGPSSSSRNSSSSNQHRSQRVDFLLDVITALLMFHRQSLLEAVRHQDGEEEQQEDIFSRCMTFLQDLPDRDDDVGPVLEVASMLRQRRIAADLTGEGGPADDESVRVEPMEGSSGAAAATMGAKARTAFNRWASSGSSNSGSTSSSATTTTKGGWLRSVSGTRDARSDSTASTATSPPPSLLNRFQASDAAAELSKVGSNWQARAMDKWAQAQARRSASVSDSAMPAPSSPSESVTSSGTGSSSAFASNLSSRFASLGWGSVGGGSNGKARAFSTSSSPRIQHPAVMQWSQGAHNGSGGGADGMPNFPLPDVMDSPDGRTEYAYVRPASMMMTGLGLANFSSPVQQRRGPSISGGGGVGTIPEEWRSASTPSRSAGGGSDRSPSLGFTSSSMSSTSSTGSAAGVNGTPRGAGPKPLLLAGSARAAVVPSADEAHNSTPPAPPSKVVRTGPLAGGSPYTPRGTQRQRGQRKRFGEASFDSSIGGGGGDESVDGDAAADSSIVDLLATPGKKVTNSSGLGNDGRQTLATSSSLQAALNTEGALPNLPSLRAAKAAGVEPSAAAPRALRDQGRDFAGEDGGATGETTIGSSGAHRPAGGLRASSGRGTVPAGAFSQATSSSSSNNDASRPAFGSIASSSDVPLVSTEARGPMRRRPPSEQQRAEVGIDHHQNDEPPSTPSSPVVADSSSIRSSTSKPATRRGAVRRRSTQPTSSSAAAPSSPAAPATPTLPAASLNAAPATPSSSNDSDYKRAGSSRYVDDGSDSPRDGYFDEQQQLTREDKDVAPPPTIGRKIYTLVDEPVNLVASASSASPHQSSYDTPPPSMSTTRKSLTQSHDGGPPPTKLNRRSASSVRSTASSAGSGERTVGSSAGGSGPIVRSKRSFKTGAKIAARTSSSTTAAATSTTPLPTPRSPLTQEHDPADDDDVQPQQRTTILADEPATTADSLASSMTRTTAESLPSSSPPSSVVSSPWARGHQALPSIDAQLLHHAAGEEERRTDDGELPTSAARFSEYDEDVVRQSGGGAGADQGEGYEYYEYFGDEDHAAGPRRDEPDALDFPADEEEEDNGDGDGDGMAAIGSALRQFSAGMQGSGSSSHNDGDVRRDSAGGIRF